MEVAINTSTSSTFRVTVIRMFVYFYTIAELLGLSRSFQHEIDAQRASFSSSSLSAKQIVHDATGSRRSPVGRLASDDNSSMTLTMGMYTNKSLGQTSPSSWLSVIPSMFVVVSNRNVELVSRCAGHFSQRTCVNLANTIVVIVPNPRPAVCAYISLG